MPSLTTNTKLDKVGRKGRKMSSSKQREKNSPFFPLIAYFFFVIEKFISTGHFLLFVHVSVRMSRMDRRFFFCKLLLFNNSHSIARCSTYDVISDQPELIVRKWYDTDVLCSYVFPFLWHLLHTIPDMRCKRILRLPESTDKFLNEF